MAAPTTSQEALDAAALGPKSVSKNGHSVSQYDLSELRKQANADAQNSANAKEHFGLRFTRLIPGERI